MIDLSRAIWAGTQAIRAIPNYAEDATTSDFATAAVQAALPHIRHAVIEELIAKSEAEGHGYSRNRYRKIHEELLHADLNPTEK